MSKTKRGFQDDTALSKVDGLTGLRRTPRLAPWVSVFATLACALALIVGVTAAPDFDRLLASFVQRWGGAASTQRFSAWRELIVATASVPEPERLKRVNDFFNRQLVFSDDPVVWGQADYWATPIESLGRGAGDCEDFAIAKYYTLRMVGVESSKLRLIYVRARTGVADGTPTQAHMVLAFYAQPDAEPVVLDNLLGDIRPASRRPDLSPVFSFNSEGVFVGATGKDSTVAGGLGRLSRWEDLLRRARAEGFE